MSGPFWSLYRNLKYPKSMSTVSLLHWSHWLFLQWCHQPVLWFPLYPQVYTATQVHRYNWLHMRVCLPMSLTFYMLTYYIAYYTLTPLYTFIAVHQAHWVPSVCSNLPQLIPLHGYHFHIDHVTSMKIIISCTEINPNPKTNNQISFKITSEYAYTIDHPCL